MAQETSFFDQNRSADLASLLSEDVQVTANAITGNLAKLYRYLNSSVGTSNGLLVQTNDLNDSLENNMRISMHQLHFLSLAHGLGPTKGAAGGTAMLLSLSPRLTLVSLSIAPVMGMSAMLYGLHARKLSKLLRAVRAARQHLRGQCAGPVAASSARISRRLPLACWRVFLARSAPGRSAAGSAWTRGG